MKLTAFQYGKTEITEAMAFPNGNPEIKLPISLLFFLIETGDKKILADVGCDTMPGFVVTEFQKPVEVLESYGIARDEITDIILTHSHHDHAECLSYYSQANVYIHESESEDVIKYSANAENIQTFRDSIRISEGITIKHIGGHTRGSAIVLLSLPETTYVLCGDECYTKENLLNKTITGCSFCPEKSMAFTEEYTKSCYHTLLFHDPDIVGKTGFKTIIEQ